jgi:hypothetical protein
VRFAIAAVRCASLAWSQPVSRPCITGVAHILETDNAEQLRKYLASRGVRVPRRVTKDRIGDTSFSVTDPDSRTVEFVQSGPGGRSMRAKGEFMDDRRASTHLSPRPAPVGRLASHRDGRDRRGQVSGRL